MNNSPNLIPIEDHRIQLKGIPNYGKCQLNSHNQISKQTWGNNYFHENNQNKQYWKPIQTPNLQHHQFSGTALKLFQLSNSKPKENHEVKKLQQNLNTDLGLLTGNLLGLSGLVTQNIQTPMMQIKETQNYIENNNLLPNKNWANQQKNLHKSKIINPNQVDYQAIHEQQVIFIEPSPNKLYLQQLKQNNQIFQDKIFPHSQQSLTGQWGYIQNWAKFKWRRASQMFKNVVIFDQKIQPSDIKQGYLGNCYFLAALAALAQTPERITNLFLQLQQNQQKYYAVKLMYKGKWKTIEVDQWFPFAGSEPAFSKSINNQSTTGGQLWVMILQKAWAKLFGSYKNIQIGFGQQGIHDLTGAHIQAVRFQTNQFDKQKSWKYFLDASRLHYCMIGSTVPGSDRNQTTSGIVMGHAYTILKFTTLNFFGSQVRLVHLRNPWGKTEAKTAWSDNDPRWNQVSETEKKRIGYTRNQNDGSFFQHYDDFIKDFKVVNVAQINDRASYVYFAQKSSVKKGNYFKVTIQKEGNYSFQINQTPQRAYSRQVQDQYKYSPITLLIGRIKSNNQIQYLQGTQSAYRTCFKKHHLVPGEYVIFGKIFFNKYERDFELTLAIYGDYICQIKKCPESLSNNFKQKLFINKAQAKGGKQILPGLFYVQQVLMEGYTYICCWNNSQQTEIISVKVEKNPNPTVHLKKPCKGRTTIDLQMKPGATRIVLGRIPDYGYETGGIGTILFQKRM